MTLRQFVRELQNALGQAVGSTSMQLGKGQCATIEEYKSKTGFIRGLESASQTADALLRQAEDMDRQNDLPPMPPAGDGQ